MDAGARREQSRKRDFDRLGEPMFTTRRRFAALVSGSLAAAGLARAAAPLAPGGAEDPPNVFISPAGRPYRAPPGASYPVADWFKDADRDGDGKLDPKEFEADAAAFFDFLDQKGDGVLDAEEIAFYEHRIAPEVLGMRVTVYADGRTLVGPGGATLWMAQQYGPLEGGPFGPGNQQGSPTGPGGPGQPKLGSDPQRGVIVPKDALPNGPPTTKPVAGLGGATPYGLTREAEPVTAADTDYLTQGIVRRANFLAHAQSNFTLLDQARSGYLTLAGLPQSQVQKLLEESGRKS
jgi:hypothetical protein